MSTWIGIDTGGTLTKLAYMNDQQELTLTVFPSNEMHLVREWLEKHPQVEEIGLTGGRTEQLRDVLKTMKSIQYIVEFEATLKGVRYLLEKEGHSISQSIITNIGTGTSIHYMDGNSHQRVGGTGVGGGTLIGLATIMTGISDFDEIKSNAFEGSRDGIDLLVKDIYQGMDTPIDGNLTASNFGKVGITEQREFDQNDVLATTQGLIGEVISTLSIQLAEQHNTDHIVYIGSTLIDNIQLKKVIEHYTILKKHKPIFLQDCGFSGAIGALINIREHHKI
ncbi:type II pantothenate kinase [Solibacillus sp. A46]|uniref:Type II pantothenate kinase n=1 Tax=Solibacillus faecavium TaxID=2762221 RepID=A0ABR8XWV6_9BACL|nr:type II pantothenate kinase [Solibacillus faecavium]MBD8036417.1 type II pantothenate kinase [Solibacillus faecavium]